MKRILFVLILLGAFCAQTFGQTHTLPDLDRTCKNCDRRYLDSMNVFHRRPIRVNQAGFRPQDPKYAYVADKPAGTKFSVIDANSGIEEFSGVTTALMDNAPKPGMWINGSFKSIARMYEFGDSSATTGTELLTKASFDGLTKQGEYFITIGTDTSAHFNIHPNVFNAIFESALKFLGAQRCGNTNSWFHAPCHLKDGSEIGHDLTGGWHDCGDHFKVSETMTYTAYGLITTYLVYQQRAEDRFGNSYNDTVFTDGIPDILYEAKIGADFMFKLYKASKANGLIEKHDMYHSVGVGSEDHQFWDVPEKQDAMPFSKGGPDRHVAKGVGTSSGMIAAILAYFSVGWQVYDPIYADSLLEAAKDIYKNVLIPHTYSRSKGTDYVTTDELYGFYPGGSSEANWIDDAAAGALALWYATKDTMYQFDLYKNTDINDNASNYLNNNEPNDAGPYFRAGFLGRNSGFSPGGWMLDFENVHSLVLYSFAKLILSDKETALNYNVHELERDTLLQRATNLLRRLTNDGTQGRDIYTNRFGTIKATVPYNLVWTSSDWGFNRYNMGAINQFFMLSELTSGEEKQMYLNIALDNIYYNLGANPWDISFIMGIGDKNLNHPHNRAANPDGYNAGGMPYQYKCPLGAFMGGSAPNKLLKDDWNDYTVTETCADFTTGLFMPTQIFSSPLPIDNEGPLFSNIAGTPISETSAIISWDANEISLVGVFYGTTPNGPDVKTVQTEKATKGGSITLTGLTPGATYYFYLTGMDTKRNISTDDNHGQWYSFNMTLNPMTISGVTICQVDHRSAKIYWWSSGRANGLVNYGTTSKSPSETKVAGDGAVLFHEATLTDLKAGTTYYFTVSSGAATSTEYSFTTAEHAVYANLDIYVKPSAYQDTQNCSPSGGWQKCSEFIVEIDNEDTTSFEDFELRFYLGSNSNMDAVSYIKQIFDGTGLVSGMPDIAFGTPTADGVGEYYLPINVKSKLPVSGRIVFQVKFTNTTFANFNNGWSLVSHTSDSDPEVFKGIDLTQAPYFTQNESEQLEKNDKGVTVLAMTRDPYIPVYYHGKHIYGYGPDDKDGSGPVTNRSVSLNFESPFKSPRFSVEKEEPMTAYTAVARVSPTGLLDDVEKNGQSVTIVPIVPGRSDAVSVHIDTLLAYGNNYMEWVAWHNHFANMNTDNKYDCACAVVRSNVEIDSITVPPEQRYFTFTTDTINVYTGRFVEVQLTLNDSLMQQMNNIDMTVTLGAENDIIKFYTSPTSTIPTSNIDLVKGKAVFYIKADIACQSQIYTLVNSTKEVIYNAGKAIVVVEDLPPWPIISNAQMIDQNCDNVPDAMHITLSNAYTETSSFSSIKVSYGNDTLVSDKVISMEGTQLIVGLDIKDTSKNTSPSGSISLFSQVENSTKESSDFYGDGISPTIVSVSVLERLDTATADRVYLQFSEPITSPNLEWPLQLYNGNTQVSTPVTVKNVQIYNDSLNVWEFTIDFASDGSSIVKENMGAQLLLSSNIIDKAGNGVGTCSQPIINIALKILPVPMTYAYIADKDEDGLAEYVEAVFAQPVDERHHPDSISIEFGSAMPETLWTNNYTFNEARTTATLKLKTPFKLGNTNGNYTGSYQGRELIGAGLVMQHMGSGAAYETNSIPAEDKAGPVFVSATIKSSSDLDMLNISISEPLVLVDTTQTIYMRERNSAAVKGVDLNHWDLLSGAQNISSLFASDAPKAVLEGDRIRFAPLIASVFTDKNANQPATNNPWITIGGDGKPKIKYDVSLSSTVVTIDPKKVSPAVPGTDDFRVYILNPATKKLDLIQDDKIVASIDTLVNPLQGAVWTINMSVPRGSAIDEPAAWATLNTKYRILIYTNLGSYVNSIEGSYEITPNSYYSNDNKVTFFVEWASLDGKGIRSKNGRIVGTGAYISKMELENRYTPNTNLDEETQKRYSSKNSYDKTKKFGIKRVK